MTAMRVGRSAGGFVNVVATAPFPVGRRRFALRVAGIVIVLVGVVRTSADGADPATGAAGQSPGASAVYAALVAADRPVGHWPLSMDAAPLGRAPALEVGACPPRFRAGPFATAGCIDLGRGNWLRMPPAPTLDAPEITVEMIFQAKYPRSGALFGVRDGKATRFSLHATVDSPVIRLWNGSAVTEFHAVRPLTMNDWHHVALAISATKATVWLDGLRCRGGAAGGLAAAATGLPLLVGCSAADGAAERAEILVAHLAVHSGLLAEERIVARVRALGWEQRLVPPRPFDGAAERARIAARVEAIRRDHGVAVRHEYEREEFLPAAWREGSEGVGLAVDKLPAVLDEIEAFLAVVPARVTRRDLEAIYIFDRLRLGPTPVGALAFGRSIYLCCGRPAFDIRCSLYHELSHILQVAHPIGDEAWKTLLPAGFHYLGADAGVDPFGFDSRLRDDGFILRYSTTNRHEDVAVLSDWLFVRRQQTIDLCEDHPAIRRKVAAVAAWYRAIDSGYDFSLYDTVLANTDAAPLSAPAAGVNAGTSGEESR